MTNDRAAALTAAEDARCNALVERDFDRLRTLLSPDLTHTHTGGNTEDYDLYFSLLQGPMRYLKIERQDMNIRFYGPVAVMTGMQRTTGRMGEGDPITLEVKVIQVWHETPAGWRMVAYQGTRMA